VNFVLKVDISGNNFYDFAENRLTTCRVFLTKVRGYAYDKIKYISIRMYFSKKIKCAYDARMRIIRVLNVPVIQ